MARWTASARTLARVLTPECAYLMPFSPRETDEHEVSPRRRRGPRPDSPIHPLSLLAGASSAAVAAVVGGHLGLKGTILGAAVGSIVAAITGASVRGSVDRGRVMASRMLGRTRPGNPPEPGLPPATPSPAQRGQGWLRRGAMVGAGFALGIAGLLGVQAGLGRYLSPGTAQLQAAAVRVVAPSTVTRHPDPVPQQPTATTTVTETATPSSAATSSPSDPSATASQTAAPTTPAPTAVPTTGTSPTAGSTPSSGPSRAA